MDIEFHYYMTYLIAARAGYPPKEAETIAHSCQMVDDNTSCHDIGTGSKHYQNYISQTSNILKPALTLFRIYFQFHFIPGDPELASPRQDGMSSLLNTTPGSRNARAIMEQSLAENDLYLTGIASHAFADTWAHQNFIGYRSPFNSFKGMLKLLTPNVGHADAIHQPDEPNLTWTDVRLMEPKIKNPDRFLDAAEALFRVLYAKRHPKNTDADSEVSALRKDLKRIITADKKKSERIKEYCSLAEKPAYGGQPLPRYQEDAWLDAAEDSPKNYRDTDWYRFQEKIKFYQDQISWPILKSSVFCKMNLASL